MKKGIKSAFAATLALTACFGGISTYAAFDEKFECVYIRCGCG